MKRYSFLMLCLLCIVWLSACGAASTAKTVKVAVSLPLGLDIGQEMLAGVQQALAEANNRAGNTQVELLVINTSDPEGHPLSPELEQQAAQQAVDDAAVVAYIGPAGSGQAKESMAILNMAGITQISPSVTWPGLTRPGFGPGEPGMYYPTGRRHFFRLVPSDDVQGNAAAEWAKDIGVQTVYIVDNGTDYGSGVTGIFEVTAQDIGIHVLAHDSFDGENISPEAITTLVQDIESAQPDMVYFGGGVEAGGLELVHEIRSRIPQQQIMGSDGLLQDSLIEAYGSEFVEGIYSTNLTIPVEQLESAQSFAASYEAEYNKIPQPFVAASYESMRLVLQAIASAEQPTRAGVLDAMSHIGDISGVLGTWHFDANGDISTPAISAWQIQDGKWSFIQILN